METRERRQKERPVTTSDTCCQGKNKRNQEVQIGYLEIARGNQRGVVSGGCDVKGKGKQSKGRTRRSPLLHSLAHPALDSGTPLYLCSQQVLLYPYRVKKSRLFPLASLVSVQNCVHPGGGWYSQESPCRHHNDVHSSAAVCLGCRNSEFSGSIGNTNTLNSLFMSECAS